MGRCRWERGEISEYQGNKRSRPVRKRDERINGPVVYRKRVDRLISADSASNVVVNKIDGRVGGVSACAKRGNDAKLRGAGNKV